MAFVLHKYLIFMQSIYRLKDIVKAAGEEIRPRLVLLKTEYNYSILFCFVILKERILHTWQNLL